MFPFEEDKEKLGRYLDDLILQRYKTKRAFCRAYLMTAGENPTEDAIVNLSNRMSQIKKGKKAIQIYDLPIFSELLGVSCEQLLSAGRYCPPLTHRATNYTIAASKDQSQWEAYIHREDKLILNSDEYGKTIIDYALEFENYDFLKYLMANGYIWFDSGEDTDYSLTFGAGTSITPRAIGNTDSGLLYKLRTQDDLRTKLIVLAVVRGDLQMLDDLRAREIPQLYTHAHYLGRVHPDFESRYPDRLIEHIARASDCVLDYFTDPFSIKDNVRYKDGSVRRHTFLFPYISQLLDLLISSNVHFAETAVKKAIRHNKSTYNSLRRLVESIKSDKYYTPEYMPSLWKKVCLENLDFYKSGNIVMFRAIYSNQIVDGIITNVAHTTVQTYDPVLREFVKELNESYDAIRYFKDHLDSPSLFTEGHSGE